MNAALNEQAIASAVLHAFEDRPETFTWSSELNEVGRQYCDLTVYFTVALRTALGMLYTVRVDFNESCETFALAEVTFAGATHIGGDEMPDLSNDADLCEKAKEVYEEHVAMAFQEAAEGESHQEGLRRAAMGRR